VKEMIGKLAVGAAAVALVAGGVMPGATAPVAAGPVVYPTITSVDFVWYPPDSTGYCHHVTTATLNTTVTKTTATISARQAVTSLPDGLFYMWRSFKVGTNSTQFSWGQCPDGYTVTQVRVDLFKQGAKTPYNSVVKQLPGYTCPLR
jgi:hypothetical protein